MSVKGDITGMSFGNWVVLRKDTVRKVSRNTYWVCRCVCGTERSIVRSSLISGASLSCGCMASFSHKGINATHGMSKTKLYKKWLMMNRCCYNEKDGSWVNYGGRGVTVCDEWRFDFPAFAEWANKNGYNDSLTIERIDVNGNYCPSNCRWVTKEEQQSNKTNTIRITYNGREMCLGTVCSLIGFPYKTAHKRYCRLKGRGEEITAEKLFAPINESKISFRYRN